MPETLSRLPFPSDVERQQRAVAIKAAADAIPIVQRRLAYTTQKVDEGIPLIDVAALNDEALQELDFLVNQFGWCIVKKQGESIPYIIGISHRKAFMRTQLLPKEVSNALNAVMPRKIDISSMLIAALAGWFFRVVFTAPIFILVGCLWCPLLLLSLDSPRKSNDYQHLLRITTWFEITLGSFSVLRENYILAQF